jgi:hypothetical protein
MNRSDIERQFGEELAALEASGEYLAFTMSPSDAWYLFSLLQVMWRRPEVATLPDIGPFVRKFADQIETRLCKAPAMAEIARRGWNPAQDVPFRTP